MYNFSFKIWLIIKGTLWLANLQMLAQKKADVTNHFIKNSALLLKCYFSKKFGPNNKLFKFNSALLKIAFFSFGMAKLKNF